MISLVRSLESNKVYSRYLLRYALDLTRLAFGRSLSENKVVNLENPLVSVIIPTWMRTELLISRALPSVLSQTYEHMEILVVSDGKNQSTRRAVADVRDWRVRYLEVPSKAKRSTDPFVNWLIGPARAMNFGTKMSRGHWIAKLDDDDEWTPDSLSLRLQAAIKNRWEVVTAGATVTDAGVTTSATPREINSVYFADPHGRYGPRRLPRSDVKVGSINTALYVGYLRFFVWDSNCWRKSHNRNNDLDFFIRLYNLKVRFGYLDETCVIRKPRPGHETLGSSAALNSPNTYRGEADIKRF